MTPNADDHIRDRPDDERNYRSQRSPQRDEFDEDDEDEIRRVRRRNEGDVTGGLIPYKNPMALAAYYCGVFGLISCVIFLGIFGILPIIFGFLGLKHAREHPEARGRAHAITGIVLGIIEVLTFLAQVIFIIGSFITARR